MPKRWDTETKEKAIRLVIEPRGGLVQHQKFRRMHESEHEADLLPVVFGKFVGGAVHHHVEALREFPGVCQAFRSPHPV